MILAHLANALRVHTTLTTNFDTLIEDAFACLGTPLVPFGVHQKVGLPLPGLVLSQPSIVKLHGDRYGLRADFSLDENPSELDMKAFAGYFTAMSGEGRYKIYAGEKHLLVFGVSGDDKRTINLIHYALDKIKAMRLFWVCYIGDNMDTIVEKFRFFNKNDKEKIVTKTHLDLGLFLLELYQHLYLSLPPSHANFPTFWPVHPGRCENQIKGKEE